MTNAILAFFIVCFLLSPLRHRWSAKAILLTVSVLSLLNANPKALTAGLILLVVNCGLAHLACTRPMLRHRFVPFIYAAILLICHQVFKWKVTGISYLVLSASWDLWRQTRECQSPGNWKSSLFNLVSFPKTAVGPITSAQDHYVDENLRATAYGIATQGILKAYLLAPLLRQSLPCPELGGASGPVEYLAFGLWNYVHLYLEFSGATEVVAASFLILGVHCPLNFNRPYLALSVTEFWKRWHLTLGLWIRNHIFIALGGSRVSKSRVYGNLVIAMLLCGVWHGFAPNFALWGLLQGVLLVGERAVGLEGKIAHGGYAVRGLAWFWTQSMVTLSWVVFFWN